MSDIGSQIESAWEEHSRDLQVEQAWASYDAEQTAQLAWAQREEESAIARRDISDLFELHRKILQTETDVLMENPQRVDSLFLQDDLTIGQRVARENAATKLWRSRFETGYNDSVVFRRDRHTKHAPHKHRASAHPMPARGGLVDTGDILTPQDEERLHYVDKIVHGQVKIVDYGFRGQTPFAITEDNRAFVQIKEGLVEVDPTNFIRVDGYDPTLTRIIKGQESLIEMPYQPDVRPRKMVRQWDDVVAAMYEIAGNESVNFENYSVTKEQQGFEGVLRTIESIREEKGIEIALEHVDAYLASMDFQRVEPERIYERSEMRFRYHGDRHVTLHSTEPIHTNGTLPTRTVRNDGPIMPSHNSVFGYGTQNLTKR